MSTFVLTPQVLDGLIEHVKLTKFYAKQLKVMLANKSAAICAHGQNSEARTDQILSLLFPAHGTFKTKRTADVRTTVRRRENKRHAKRFK